MTLPSRTHAELFVKIIIMTGSVKDVCYVRVVHSEIKKNWSFCVLLKSFQNRILLFFFSGTQKERFLMNLFTALAI